MRFGTRNNFRQKHLALSCAAAAFLGSGSALGQFADETAASSDAGLSPLDISFVVDGAEAPLNAQELAHSVVNQISIGHTSLEVFTAPSSTVSYLPDGSRFEFQIASPTSPDSGARLFDPASAIDPSIALPYQDANTSVALRYVTDYSAFGGQGGLDLSLLPRAGVSLGPDGSGVSAGAEVRLGQFLQPRGERPQWYMFAGAERQALLYDPRDGWNARDAMTLESYAVVGDAQAGVALRVGDQDISFAYVRRERSTHVGLDGYEASDDFAAFSLSRRW